MEERNENGYRARVWTREIKEWLSANTCRLSGKEAWELFRARFPDVKATYNALTTKRSELGLGLPRRPVRGRPLYSETVKKDGYVYIKVQMHPARYISKARWVYAATHPEEAAEIRDTDSYFFADGDTRNFFWRNILRVPRSVIPAFINAGGPVKGDPQATRVNLARAMLKIAMLDAAERHGQVVKSGRAGRILKSVARERAKIAREKLKSTAEGLARYREMTRASCRRQRERMTDEDREKIKAYKREWARRRREERRQ